MSIEAMKRALKDLEDFISIKNDSHGAMGYHLTWILREHITALRTAIEQAEKSQDIKSGIETVAAKGGLLPQQEPVAWDDLLGAVARGWGHSKNAHKEMDSDLAIAIAEEVRVLYAKPTAAQREWVGLTDDDIKELWDVWKDALCLDLKTWACAIETKLKEKNA